MVDLIQMSQKVVELPIENLSVFVSLAGLGVAALAIVAVFLIARDKREGR